MSRKNLKKNNFMESKKMNLSAIEDRLSVYEMQEIQAGCGWRCTLGSTGSAVLGGLAGLSAGPAGAWFGYWAGGAVGYATFC